MTSYSVIYNPQSGKQGATRIAKRFAAAAEKRGHVVRQTHATLPSPQ